MRGPMVSTRKRKTDKTYFLWLCGLVGITRSDPGPLELAWMLYTKKYYGVFPNDDNRTKDGKNLRESFCNMHKWCDIEKLSGPCSVLEMLIALAQRMDYQLGDLNHKSRLSKWFYEFIKNLDLAIPDTDDPKLMQKAEDNNRILDDWMQRKIMYNGKGGLFPLKHPKEDQRQVEIWYQLMAYLDENYAI